VATAICGMSPSDLSRGRRVCSAGSGLSWHCFTSGSSNWRRHLPLVMMSGMFTPAGAFGSEKWPASSLFTATTGTPGSESVQWPHTRPCATGPGSSFGT